MDLKNKRDGRRRRCVCVCVFESWHFSKHFGLNDFIIAVIITVYCKSFPILVRFALLFFLLLLFFCAILICFFNEPAWSSKWVEEENQLLISTIYGGRPFSTGVQ